MHIYNKRKTACAKYTINGLPLICVSGVKYLGVSISSMMSWGDQIDDICAKAIIRFHSQEFTQLRNQAYASLVRPTLEHACRVWDPHPRKHIKQLESVQRHAAPFTTGNYYSMNSGCVTNMVTHLGWNLLEH